MRTLIFFLLSFSTTLAQLPETGSLSIKSAAGSGRSISQQVDGNETGNKSLTTLSTTAGFSAPHSMLEFRGWPTVSPPNAPSSCTATEDAANSRVTFSWSAPSGGPGFAYYSRLLFVDGVQVGTWGNTGSGTTAHLTNPEVGKAYKFRVRACNESDVCGDYCESNEVTYTGIVPPTAPSTVFASLSGSDVSLSWSGASGDITTYRIERRTNAGAYGFLANDAASPYTDNTVSTGNEYQYRVRAEGPGGNSSYTESNTVNTTTPPGLPRNVTATPTSGKITVSWLVPSSGGSPANYTIERSVNFGSFGAWRSTLDASTSIDDTMVLPGNYYNYRVRANNAGGSSGWVESGDVCYQGPCI